METNSESVGRRRARRYWWNIVAGVLLLLCIGAVVMWIRSYGAQAGGFPSTDGMQATLARPVAAMSFDHVTLQDTLDFLTQVTGAKIEVDWPALKGAGIAPEMLITSKLKTVRMGEALVDVLPVGKGLGYTTGGNVIFISTRDALNKGASASAGKRSTAVVTGPSSPLWEGVWRTRRWTLAAYRGQVRLWCTPPDPASPYQEGVPVGSAAGLDAGKGFNVGVLFMRQVGSPLNTWIIGMPFWGLVAIFGLLPLLWLWGLIRELRRPLPGHCTVCGYDLRASTERCPECGESIGAGGVQELAR